MQLIRNGDVTRSKILTAASEEMHQKGFQGLRLDGLLKKVELTKGAFYHHFCNKMSLGYAVVDEIIFDFVMQSFVTPLSTYQDPIYGISEMLDKVEVTFKTQFMKPGCPLQNLAQEMSPIDEGFRLRINNIYQVWSEGIACNLKKGQQNGMVKHSIDVNKAAIFIVASISGCVGLAKNSQSTLMLSDCYQGLYAYMETLKA